MTGTGIFSEKENRIKEICREIRGTDPDCYRKSKRQWDSLAMPLGSLGVLEEDIAGIAALTGKVQVTLRKRILLVVCADNGVVARGVSQTDATVTTAVAAALGAGNSTVSYIAREAGCTVLPVDVGMKEETPEGVLGRKIRSGTGDITAGPAMTREECVRAVLLGVELVRKQAEGGTDILLTGEMGIGNTTTSAAVACVLLGREPQEITGRGAGLSEDGWKRKIQVIREAIRVNGPDPSDPLDVLQKVGGLDLAVLCGICLGGALCRLPILLDGMITNAAALCAVRLCPVVREALIASHVSDEPAASALLEALGLPVCIHAGLRLGEGSGAVMALSLLDQALAVYQSGHTFQKLGIEAYTPK